MGDRAKGMPNADLVVPDGLENERLPAPNAGSDI
jgi:hypothetical protein